MRQSSLVIIYLLLALTIITQGSLGELQNQDVCQYTIVESMPDKMVFNSTHDSLKGIKPTHVSLIQLINESKKTLRIASFYWMLTAEAKFVNHPSALPGKQIMSSLAAAAKRNVNIQVLIDGASGPSMSSPDDLKQLESIGSIRYLNMKRLLKNGVMHSKFLIADNESLYLGSSNFDWRSYTQIKEIGIEFSKCNQMAEDLEKTFRTYWLMATLDAPPAELPAELNVTFNKQSPHTDIDPKGLMYFANSPPAFNGLRKWNGRTEDIDALLSVIDSASKFAKISVMNYSPRTQFMWPKRFWPRIHDALIKAATERRVMVSVLISNWTHIKPEELMWYKSMDKLQSPTLGGGGIRVRMFRVPAFDSFQASIPFARVKHDKYLVTDNSLYLGTSNWTPDYFINTCGVSLTVSPKVKETPSDLVLTMNQLFDRDFGSSYTHELEG